MKTVRFLLKHWYLILIGIFMGAVLDLYLIRGSSAYAAVHDNLDLFQAQYKMLKDTGTFFSHGTAAPFLGGVSRDVLPTEWSLTSFLYMILPAEAAYFAIYFVKIILAVVSFRLFFREVLSTEGGRIAVFGEPADPSDAEEEDGETDRFIETMARIRAFFAEQDTDAIITAGGFIYGILNLFPSFGICFAVIPLVPYFAMKLIRARDRRAVIAWTAAFFLYPLLSYFSYFGLFLLGYLLIAVIILLFRDRKKAVRLLLGTTAMAVGSAVFEYRLFGMMLFSDTVTIRSTFTAGDLSAEEILQEMGEVFSSGIFHAADAHEQIVMPVVILGILLFNLHLIQKKKFTFKGFLRDPLTVCMLLILFNTAVYGLYNCGPFRTFVETILPPLKGWQFNRTVFFSPFLWYLAFVIVMLRLSVFKAGQKDNMVYRGCVYALLAGAVLVIIVTPGTFNDLRNNLRAQISERNGVILDDLSYGEFYSEALFDEIKSDIGYEKPDMSDGSDTPSSRIEAGLDPADTESSIVAEQTTGTQWAVAYGLHPAVLEYNGIATLDGYLGFYPQSYKDAFRTAIEPALEERETTRVYYDDWGARCYLYSGSEDTVVQAVRNYQTVSDTFPADADALRALGCRYVFSRVGFSDAVSKGMNLIGTYSSDDSPYTVYVYDLCILR